MKKLNKSISNALKLTLVLALLITTFATLSVADRAYAVSLKDDLGLSNEYALGTEVEIPAGTLIVNGAEYAADAVVYLPDGDAVKADKITLDKVGKYTIKYTALAGEKYYSKSVDFYAKKTVMSVAGTGSTYFYDAETDRIHLDLAANEVFTFNQPIDLTGRTMDDPLLSLYVDATSNMSRDFEEFIIVLTDAYDASNKVYVSVKGDHAPTYHPTVWDYDSEAYDVYGYGLYQAYTGVNFDGGKEWMFYSGSTDKVMKTEQWSQGKPVWISFCNRATENQYNPVDTENDTFTLSYDDVTKGIHVLSAVPFGERVNNQLIADLDDMRYFQNNWAGFTNGMVYISVYAQDVHTSAKFVIKNIDTDLPKTGLISDTLAPVITPDLGEYSGKSMPDAIVGKSYKLPSASALDATLTNKNVSMKVYYNYNTTYKSLVPVNGNSFIPERPGAYTVVYQAMDDFGNIGEATLNINATNSAKPLAITGEAIDATAGLSTAIPAPALASFDGATGNLYLTVRAKKNNVDDLIYAGLLSEYNSPAYSFMLTGEWDIEYTVSDYSRSSTAIAKATVTATKTIIYDNFDLLPIDKYLVCGNIYVLPRVQVVSFKDDETVYTDAQIKVSYGDSVLYLESNLLTVTEAMGSSIMIEYFDANNSDVKISGTREVINIGKVYDYDLSKLFLTSNATVESTFDDIRITSSADASAEFVNKISANELDLRFNLLSVGRSFGKFNIILTDAENDDIQVKVNIENLFNSSSLEAGNSKIYLNSDNSAASTLMSAASFTGLNNRYFDISYSDLNKALKHDNKSLTVTNCVNGDKFEGFTSGYVYVTFEMVDVSGESVVALFFVNGQAMSEFTEDYGKPVVNVNGSYASTYGINETISTLTAVGSDVISGYSEAKISIRRIGAGVVTDVNGLEIENVDAGVSYDILLSEYGEYLVTYFAYDASGNLSVSNYFSFYVEDIQDPEIELKNEPVKTAFVGDKFIMPEVVGTDDNTENPDVFVIIVDPLNKYTAVTEAGYTFDTKGTHKVILGVFDGEGNMTTIQYYVEVI